jgi:hypothetical protein
VHLKIEVIFLVDAVRRLSNQGEKLLLSYLLPFDGRVDWQ